MTDKNNKLVINLDYNEDKKEKPIAGNINISSKGLDYSNFSTEGVRALSPLAEGAVALSPSYFSKSLSAMAESLDSLMAAINPADIISKALKTIQENFEQIFEPELSILIKKYPNDNKETLMELCFGFLQKEYPPQEDNIVQDEPEKPFVFTEQEKWELLEYAAANIRAARKESEYKAVINNLYTDYDTQYTRDGMLQYRHFFIPLIKKEQYRNVDHAELVTIIASFLHEKKDKIEDIYFPTTADIKLLLIFTNDYFRRKNYHQLPQNSTINKIIKAQTEAQPWQLDITNTATIEIDRNFILQLQNYKGPISASAKILFDILNMEYAKNSDKSGSLQIPLKTYMEYRGTTDINVARRSVVKGMDELKGIVFRAKEKSRGKWKDSGSITLWGGTGYVKNGIIFWNYNVDFLPILDNSFIMDLPTSALKYDTRKNPNSYYIARQVAENYRINEGKDREKKISIRTLLNACPELSKLSETEVVKKNPKGRIIEPFLRDLNALNDCYFDIVNKLGVIVDYPETLPLKDFLECFLKIDYSEYPKHPERITAKITRAKRQSKTIK